MCSPRLCPVISDIGLSLITCLCHWIPNISYLSYLGLHPSLKVGNTPHNKEKNVSHSFTRNIASMWLVNNSFQPEAHRISEGFFDSRDPFRSPSVTGLPSTKLQFEMPLRCPPPAQEDLEMVNSLAMPTASAVGCTDLVNWKVIEKVYI